MLYFLEVLMNSNGPLTISQLAGRFGSRSFSAEMRSAAGGNEAGLKKFLLKYPSLFTVTGNMVSLFDSSKAPPPSERDGSPSSTSGRSLPDVSAEMEAVSYFQNKLAKKEERWVPIKSLAGHLSQAEMEVRNCVGPQLEFRKWLLRHPHIFEVQGELVGLRDGLAAVATPTFPRRHFDNGFSTDPLPATRIVPPRTPPPSRKFAPKTPPPVRRSHSFSERRANQMQNSPPENAAPSTPGARRRGVPVTMTANEYKAVMFLKDIVEKRGGIKVHNITGHFSQAPEGVRNTIGWTKMELEEFLKKNAHVFSVSEDEVVSVIKNAKLNVIIIGSKPQGQSVRTLMGRKGKIFHVAKLWGIIDLGRHEHVFFDKSIMTRPIDDLQRDYKVGETLYFNAVLAAKTSRAKWRATHVWKEHEQQPSSTESDVSAQEQGSILSPSTSIEDEINRFLPIDDIDTYSDAAPSGAGIVPVWNMKDENNIIESSTRPSMVPESHYMNNSAFNDLRLAAENALATPEAKVLDLPGLSALQDVKPSINGTAALKSPLSSSKNKVSFDLPEAEEDKNTREVGCQTISTGVIIATQLYHEDL
jgi:exonuclease 3'-5' domain-containing protein 1